jgi:hypothetical protein
MLFYVVSEKWQTKNLHGGRIREVDSSVISANGSWKLYIHESNEKRNVILHMAKRGEPHVRVNCAVTRI